MDKSLIPKGDYCYTSLEFDNKSNKIKVQGICPYWRNRKDVDNKEVHSQNYGYCLFLGKGDLEINSEDKLKLVHPVTHPDYNKEMTADEIGIGFSVLWDMVKMCSENIHDSYVTYEN